VFFLGPDDQVYARYGGRDATSPDARQSLDGLRYTMQSVLAMHQLAERVFAPRPDPAVKYAHQINAPGRARGCLHCHNVRERLDAELKRMGQWTRELTYRYPLPDNLGILLEVDRGNVVRGVVLDSPGARAGLRPGDVLRRLGGVPIHSQADAQFALDRAPRLGEIALAWERDGAAQTGDLALAPGWRRGDISWRPSLMHLVPSLPLYGTDLTTDEKQALGLAPKQLAFRLKSQVHSSAKAAGMRAGDIILGVDDRRVDGQDVDLQALVRREYLVGDRVVINVLRDGQRLGLPLTLR
jgi:predicted metalloprotease with PDZ domain